MIRPTLARRLELAEYLRSGRLLRVMRHATPPHLDAHGVEFRITPDGWICAAEWVHCMCRWHGIGKTEDAAIADMKRCRDVVRAAAGFSDTRKLKYRPTHLHVARAKATRSTS